MAGLAGSALTYTGDNIKTDLNENEWEGAHWSQLAQDILEVVFYDHGTKPMGSIICGNFLSS